MARASSTTKSTNATPSSNKRPRKESLKGRPSDHPKKRMAAAVDVPASKKRKEESAGALPTAATTGSSTEPSACRLERAQVERALEALSTYVSSKNSAGGLINEDSVISVVISTKRMPKTSVGAKAVKPRLLSLPHPWRDLDSTEVCLIVKDPQRAVKDLCAAERIGAKVIGVEKLKKKYVPFEARRKLRAAFDFFGADERVIPLLPKLLGSEFYKSNKLPLPLNLKRKNLREHLQCAVGGAILRPTAGTCLSLQCASSTQEIADAADNVITVVEKVVARTRGHWENVQAIHLRTVNSVALPIYTAL